MQCKDWSLREGSSLESSAPACCTSSTRSAALARPWSSRGAVLAPWRSTAALVLDVAQVLLAELGGDRGGGGSTRSKKRARPRSAAGGSSRSKHDEQSAVGEQAGDSRQ